MHTQILMDRDSEQKDESSDSRPERCGGCCEFIRQPETCGHPMVYLNHGDNTHRTTANTQACGYFYPVTPALRK